jgi:peptide/nickel transport system substrate-binding protein
MSREPSRFERQQLHSEVLTGNLTRREVLKRGVALGLSAPAIAGLLAACGGGEDATATKAPAVSTTGTGGGATPTTGAPATSPTAGSTGASPTTGTSASPATGGGTSTTPGHGRGKGDLLRILYWQAPTILNTHFAQGDKDSSAGCLVLEPLITFDKDGNPIPVLAAEAPSLENGGVAADGKSVTYKLKQGVTWSDGEPFTSKDVEFTWKFATDPDGATVSLAQYQVIDSIDVIDDYTVMLNFKEANPAWFTPFATGYFGCVLPEHILKDSIGAKGRDSDFNLKPIGTGPYKVKEFKPGDVVNYEINENYREADKPYFKTVELKGGGDATAAATAAMQTGETDWAWNLQVEKTVLDQLSGNSDTGTVAITPGQSLERILINFADPNKEVDGAKAEPSTQHPFLTDKNVRMAFALACDRETISTQLYGQAGNPAANLLVSPERFNSKNTSFKYDLDAANKLLDDAGWVKNGDTRKKGDVELKVLYQTTVNPLRQKTQEINKASWGQIGVGVELKSIDAGVFFASDAGNPDTSAHFYADFEMFTNGPTNPYPIDYMLSWRSSDPAVDLAQKSNQWAGTNYERWVNDDYNKLWQQARTELDPDKQVPLFTGMNDLVVNEVVEICLVQRNGVTGVSK